ncbi:MAG TPA: LysE family transporter [Gammaproteobacteria bacterium]|nr:LysE family transporter [Gammaproteobacteria bacterium]
MTDFMHIGVWHAIAGGALMAISIAAPPGPVTTIMANASMRGRVRESLVTACGAISGDVMWLALAILGTVTFLNHRPHLVGAIGLAGALLLLWMAWSTWRSARTGLHAEAVTGSWKIGFFTVLTSPFSIAWWLANGTLLYSVWGWPGIAAFFITGSLYAVAYSYAFRWVGRRAVSAILWVAYASVAVLAGFGLYVAWASLRLLQT